MNFIPSIHSLYVIQLCSFMVEREPSTMSSPYVRNWKHTFILLLNVEYKLY